MARTDQCHAAVLTARQRHLSSYRQRCALFRR